MATYLLSAAGGALGGFFGPNIGYAAGALPNSSPVDCPARRDSASLNCC